MLLYLDDCFANHQTGQHPECVARIERLNAALRSSGWADRASCPAWEPATAAQLLPVHSQAYLTQLEHWCRDDAGQIESDTVVSNGSWNAALRGAGAATDAVQRVLAGEDTRAFCAVRPPGHHAVKEGPMGFCLLNNAAVAAEHALSLGLDSVLIIDWDVHHGNGTQDAFYDHGRVGFFSIHRSPFYPGTGSEAETGTGAGLGCIANVPVAADVSLRRFMDDFTRGIEALAQRTKPQLILLSAGFDAHRNDPVGGLCLEEGDFAELTKIVTQLANATCHGRLVSLLEGGYHLEHMPTSVLAHLSQLAELKT